IQHEVEQALIHLVGLAQKHVGINKLCLSGGVALNSVANYTLLRQLALDDIFIFPAAGDAGIAAGCALYAYVEHEKAKGKAPHRELLRSAFLGRRYTDSDMRVALDARAEELLVIERSRGQMVSEAAQAMAAGKIVGRFEGGAEYGPRALGNRSI